MATQKRTGSFVPAQEGASPLRSHTTVPFNEISDPGTYYNQITGWLWRVPTESLSLGHSPTMNVLCNEENFVTKISDDPYIPVNKARQICSNMDFLVNF
ncbi:MAG: hypothetical protein V3T31_04535 [candidate division Zixibacteria bacterium]